VLLSIGTTACGASAVEGQYQHVLDRATPSHRVGRRTLQLVPSAC
jgi:hypothetical protein